MIHQSVIAANGAHAALAGGNLHVVNEVTCTIAVLAGVMRVLQSVLLRYAEIILYMSSCCNNACCTGLNDQFV